VRLVKGSHIVVPKVHSQGHAYLFQNDDKRVIFVIPSRASYSLIGTTDVPVSSVRSDGLRRRTIAGDRILVSAGEPVSSRSRSSLGRRLVLRRRAPALRRRHREPVAGEPRLRDEGGRCRRRAPLLTLFGGKITTYRTLAESVLAQLEPYYAWLGGAWTANEPLPGGDVAHFNAFRDDMHHKYAGLPRDLVEGITRRHGNRTVRVLGDSIGPDDLGKHFGAGSPSAKSTISSPRSGRRPPRTSSGAGRSAGCT
jgi:glycerol-3-phosphate dehydrogenase